MFERFTMTAKLIYQALTDPESLQRKNITPSYNSLSNAQLAWAYYEGKMFSSDADWSTYLADLELYSKTKLLFNPVPNVVDFYVDNIWQSPFYAKYPKLVTPCLKTTDETILNAVGQLDVWSNWWLAQEQVKQFTASTGACLIEIFDDVASGKITQKTQWRGFITEIELNEAGDVQRYTIEYGIYDPITKQNYTYKKEVDKETFRYYKDGKPFDYPGKTSVMPNVYGFCPAVYFAHSSGDNGAFTDFSKVNHTNGLATHLHDNIHKEIESGKIMGLEDPSSLEVVTGGYKNKDGTINEIDPRLDRLLLATKGNVSVNDLSGLLKLAEAHPYLADILLSFADDYPELEYRSIIKANGQLSGRALERLLTPAQNRLDRVSPNYDGQLVKLRQMQMSMAGFRVRNGWSDLTEKQRLFADFDLSSYERGELDFNLNRSILIEPNEIENEELLAKKAERARILDGVVDVSEQMRIAGYSDEEIEAIAPLVLEQRRNEFPQI